MLASLTPFTDELNERALGHDASKFGPEERLPYIWLTEFHRCRRSGEPFTHPEGMEERVRAAIAHHVTTNRHHPEYHADPNDMTDADLIEMVCDWTAVSERPKDTAVTKRELASSTLVLPSRRAMQNVLLSSATARAGH